MVSLTLSLFQLKKQLRDICLWDHSSQEPPYGFSACVHVGSTHFGFLFAYYSVSVLVLLLLVLLCASML